MSNIPIRKLDDHSYEILENDRKGLTNIPIRLLDNHEILKDFDKNYLQELDDHGILKVNQWHGMIYIFELYLKGIDVCQDFDLRQGWQFKSSEARALLIALKKASFGVRSPWFKQFNKPLKYDSIFY